MRFEIERDGIKIIPENDQDRAYIEDTLGLRFDKAAISLVRRNAMGLSSIAFLVTARPENRPVSVPGPKPEPTP